VIERNFRISVGSNRGHDHNMPRSADSLLLSLFERQANALFACSRIYGVHVTAGSVAGRVVDDASRYITRVRLNRDDLRLRLEQLLTVH
jgi:hypothetical protein